MKINIEAVYDDLTGLIHLNNGNYLSTTQLGLTSEFFHDSITLGPSEKGPTAEESRTVSDIIALKSAGFTSDEIMRLVK